MVSKVINIYLRTPMQFIDLKKQYQLIQDKVNQGIQNVLEHGQYILGPEVKTFESMAAEYVGAEYCVSCASGTDALLMALMAIDIQPGDEVTVTRAELPGAD